MGIASNWIVGAVDADTSMTQAHPVPTTVRSIRVEVMVIVRGDMSREFEDDF